MSSSEVPASSSTAAATAAQADEQEGGKTSPKQPLPLPEPGLDSTTKLDMSSGGGTVKLDHLGPLVVNKDGTLSRIANWEQMTDLERQNTLRILGKRNQLRREGLAAQEGGSADEK